MGRFPPQFYRQPSGSRGQVGTSRVAWGWYRDRRPTPSFKGKDFFMEIDNWLLEILVCPSCRAALRPGTAADELACSGCGLAYPVRDNIPVLLVDEARQPS